MKKFFSINYSDNGISFASLVLRLAMGIMILPYGFSKLMNFAGRSGNFYDPLHIGSMPSLCLVIFAEVFCAVFIIVGLFTRLAAIPLIITMAFALGYANHWQLFGDGQKPALFLAGYIAILFTGAGKVSLDRLVGK